MVLIQRVDHIVFTRYSIYLSQPLILLHATPKLNFYSQNIRMFLYKTWGCSSAEHGDVFTHNIPMFYMYILHKFCPRYIYPFRHILYYKV